MVRLTCDFARGRRYLSTNSTTCYCASTVHREADAPLFLPRLKCFKPCRLGRSTFIHRTRCGGPEYAGPSLVLLTCRSAVLLRLPAQVCSAWPRLGSSAYQVEATLGWGGSCGPDPTLLFRAVTATAPARLADYVVRSIQQPRWASSRLRSVPWMRRRHLNLSVNRCRYQCPTCPPPDLKPPK